MQWPITRRMLGNPRFYCMLGLMAIVAVFLAGVHFFISKISQKFV